MKATQFEFKYRGLLIGVTLWIGYATYTIDHVSIIQVVAGWIAGRHPGESVLIAKLLVGVAALLVGIGAAVRTWGAAYLKSSVVHDSRLHADELVADGPYRHVRHPLYFASIIAFVGFAMLASRLGSLIILVPMTLLYLRLAGREEHELERSQGNRYRAYARTVPRLWPSMRARVPATGAKPQWGQAFVGEGFMWAFTLAFALFAITLNVKLMWWTISIALFLLVAQSIIHNRRKKATSAAA
jgi:protein-S-isoprenylcysteine O-methyltransferase Ste14